MDVSVERLLSSFRVPDSIKKSFIHASHTSIKERLLFQNVAARAILDALGMTGLEEPAHGEAARLARQWFKHFPADVEMIFDLADIPSDGIWTQLQPKRPTKSKRGKRRYNRAKAH
jgi:hypothetical protein